MDRKYDVFISHAGEDKDSLAVPIYNDLRRRGIRVFLDRPELQVGGVATEDMIEAMKTALIGLFILSPEFAAKVWTMKELFCFEERANEADSSEDGSSAVRPVLIPIFYRLTVAETRYRLVFKKYPEVCARHGFMDRLDKGEVVMSKVLDTLAALTARTGIEYDSGSASTEGSRDVEKRRGLLVQRIGDEVANVLKDKFPKERTTSGGEESTRGDVFEATFYAPENADEVQLDFSGALREGVRRSREAEVLGEVLRDENDKEYRKVVCIKGNAGVGKSCILRAMARQEEVRRRFPGGVYFLSLGMDASVETLISELVKMVRMSGGHKRAAELKGEKSLDIVLERVGRWMKGKRCLMLVDDLWDRRKLGAGIVPRLAKVLCTESCSAVVITTRFDSVSIRGKVVEVSPRDPMSEEAKSILLRYAGFSAEEVMGNSTVRGIFEKLLRMCGGLPVCLAAMGRGLRMLGVALGSRGVEVWKRYSGMMDKGQKLIRREVEEYGDLRTTLSVSVKVLEERLGKYEERGGELSWGEMHRSFCVMKKQAAVRVEVFVRMWGLCSVYEGLEVVQGFSGAGLASMEGGSDEETTYVRLHDLIHDFSRDCARSEGEECQWHGRVLDGYIRGEGGGGVREWWSVENDGYIFENVCRHLRESGNTEELIEVLLNVRWAKARLEHGGLVGWIGDFRECIEGMEARRNYSGDEKEELKEGLVLVRDAVAEGWPFLSENERELGFQLFGRLWGIRNWAVRKFLESVEAGHDRPWAKGIGRWWDRPGRRGRGGEFVLQYEVLAIAVDDERQVLVAGAGEDVVFIDMEGMEVVRTCEGHEEMVRSVSLSNDGSRVYSLSRDGVLREWEVETGEEVGCVSLKNDGGNESDASDFWCAAICVQRNFVVTGSGRGTVEVWHIESGERRGGEMGGFDGSVWCVSVSRDGRRIVAGGRDGTLRVWDVSTRAQIGAVMRGHKYDVNCVAFSPDGELVASGSDDKTIRVWEVESGTQRGDAIHGHVGWVRCVCFSEDGQRIISGGHDRTVRIWDAASGAQVGRSLLGHTHLVLCVSVTRDGRFVVSGGWDKAVRVWDLAASTDDTEERPEDASDVRCVDVSVDGRWFVSGSGDGAVRVYDGSSGKQVGDALQAHNHFVSCVAVSPCGRRFVSGSYDETLCVWDVETRTRVGEPLRGHTLWVVCVAYSPNGDFIVSGSWDKTVRVWDTVTHAQIGGPIGGGSEASTEWPMSAAEAVEEGEDSSSGSEGSSDEDSRDKSVVRHTDWVSCVRVSEDGGRIVCGLDDGGLYVWDVTSRNLVGGRRSQHSIRIKLLDMLAGNVVRSVDMFGDEKRWRLDGEDGLVRLEGSDECVQGAEGTSAEGWATGNEVICVGREVRVRGSNVKLATLPASVYPQKWCFSEVNGTIGVVLKDGRLRFLHVKE